MDLSCFSTLVSGFSRFSFLSGTLVIPTKTWTASQSWRLSRSPSENMITRSPCSWEIWMNHIAGRAQFYPGGAKRDSKRDHTTPLKHPAIEEIAFNNRNLRFKSPTMRPLQIPSSVWVTRWLNITIGWIGHSMSPLTFLSHSNKYYGDNYNRLE